jgi:hypothetical protein
MLISSEVGRVTNLDTAFLLPSIVTCHWKHNEYVLSVSCNYSSAYIITDYVSVVIAICCLAIAIYWIARGKTFEGPVSLLSLVCWPKHDANWWLRTSKPLWRKEKRWLMRLAMADVARRKIFMIILYLPRLYNGFPLIGDPILVHLGSAVKYHP